MPLFSSAAPCDPTISGQRSELGRETVLVCVVCKSDLLMRISTAYVAREGTDGGAAKQEPPAVVVVAGDGSTTLGPPIVVTPPLGYTKAYVDTPPPLHAACCIPSPNRCSRPSCGVASSPWPSGVTTRSSVRYGRCVCLSFVCIVLACIGTMVAEGIHRLCAPKCVKVNVIDLYMYLVEKKS